MRHIPIILRQLRRSSNQAVLFALCVALSLSTLTAFSGFARSVSQALLQDARKLHTADIIIRSYDPISQSLEQALAQLTAGRRVERVNIHQLYSVVRSVDGGDSMLCALKVVEPGYPFYGTVALATGRPFQMVLKRGTCIVERTLLDRTGLKVGHRLKVGFTSLTIADVVTAEPDRPVNLFSLGPRVFIHSTDLDALGLIATGGRIRRIALLKVAEPRQTDGIADQLRRSAILDQESVDTYRTAGSRVQRFLDNFLFFLKLVGLFILMMAGLGIQGTLTALLNEKQHTVAIMKTVGAGDGVVITHFLTIVLLLGALGTLMGVLSGWGLQIILGTLVKPLIPGGLAHTISWEGVAEGLLLGSGVVVLFSFLPLYRLKAMRPMMIFRRETTVRIKKWPYIVSGTLFLLFFSGLVLWHMRDLRFGLYFIGGMIALILTATALAQSMLWAIKRCRVRHMALRQAIKGLFRRGNATRAVIITLTASLGIIFANYLIEKNLDATFVKSYPPDAPNAYFVDIQKDQVEQFAAVVGSQVSFHPIVRARITAINNETIDRNKEHKKRGDNFSRVFNLTYRRHLLENETLLRGRTIFRQDWEHTQVSILDTVTEMGAMDIGDTLTFKIQGVPLKARISSIRSRSKSTFSPFFYFVFPEKALSQAPQTLFAALKVPTEQLGALQNEIVARFPNISVFNMTQAIGVFARLMSRLSGLIRAFSLFSIGAGLLILISAVFATRAERIVESVYYKILGADQHFVLLVFALENLLIGLFSSTLALIIAHTGAYYVCTTKFDLDYRLLPLASMAMIAMTLIIVTVVGLTASRSIMKKRPATYLREQPDE